MSGDSSHQARLASKTKQWKEFYQLSGKLPVVLFNHSHFGQYEVGKEEFVRGRSEMQQPPYTLALGRADYAGFCIDSWCFGERQGRRNGYIQRMTTMGMSMGSWQVSKKSISS